MRHRSPATPALAVAVAVLLAACSPVPSTSPASAGASASAAGSSASAPASGSQAPATVIPEIVSSQQIVGPNRFLFSFLDAKTNQPAAAPDRTAAVAFIAPGESQTGPAIAGTFVWGITGTTGVYVTSVDFPTAGNWTAVFVTEAPGKPKEAVGVSFDVRAKSTTRIVGEKAPSSVTPTAADVNGDVTRISTDPSPSPAFYQLSVDQAEQQGRPFVVIFATPRFCQSRQCGPTLDVVKAIAKTSPGNVSFIHVEPYKLTFTDGTLQPVLDANNQLQPTDVTNDQWGIVSEPWVFTVDRTGIIRGSFEGIVGTDELKAAIAQIAGS